MLPINGKITTELNNIYIVPTKKLGYITNIKINNTANTNYTIELYQYSNTTKKSVLLYKYELEAGKMLNDSFKYRLPAGDSFSAKASVNTVVFVMNGYELDSI